MRFFSARHGQVAPESYYIDRDPLFTPNDPPLTKVGFRQAEALACEMEKRDFSGKIVVSPYYRALQTANAVAEKLDLGLIVDPLVREIRLDPNDGFVGMTADEIMRRFPRANCEMLTEYPWVTQTLEEQQDVLKRITKAVDHWKTEECDVLVVTHGSPSVAMVDYWGIEIASTLMIYNCSLTAVDTVTGTKVGADASFLPEELRTNNLTPAAEIETKLGLR